MKLLTLLGNYVKELVRIQATRLVSQHGFPLAGSKNAKYSSSIRPDWRLVREFDSGTAIVPGGGNIAFPKWNSANESK